MKPDRRKTTRCLLCGGFHLFCFLNKTKTLGFVKEKVKSKKNINKSVWY